MQRTFLLVLCLFSVLTCKALGDIEIIVNGHQYASMASYAASKKSDKASLPSVNSSPNSSQENYILKEARKLGIKVDLNKMKTWQIAPSPLSAGVMHGLYVISFEQGVAGALQSFYAAQRQSDVLMTHPVSLDHLQEAIKNAVTVSKTPKLLISAPGKLRILALTLKDDTK